ncbi:MAG: glycerol-3-phosphate 1-O-acyltransferase PlsY [Oscillospiraceae bacterium]
MIWLWAGCTLLGGYLLGSISFAVIVSRAAKGEDVRQRGSGNAGTTNMLRSYGWLPAALTFAGDFAKGSAAALLGKLLLGMAGLGPLGGFLGGIAALAGHMRPIFFGFRGGKGVATALGAVLALEPLTFFILAGIGFPMAGISGYVSLASVCCAGGFPLLLAAVQRFQGRLDWPELALAAVLGWTIVWNHRENIRRLMNGTERRFLPDKNQRAERAKRKGGNENG